MLPPHRTNPGYGIPQAGTGWVGHSSTIPSISSDPHRAQVSRPAGTLPIVNQSGASLAATESIYAPGVRGTEESQGFVDNTIQGFPEQTVEESMRIIRNQQEAFHHQVLTRNQQLRTNAEAIEVMAVKGHTVVLDFANEVQAMRSRMNRVLEDSTHLLIDVEKGMAMTQGLLAGPLTSSTPRAPSHKTPLSGTPAVAAAGGGGRIPPPPPLPPLVFGGTGMDPPLLPPLGGDDAAPDQGENLPPRPSGRHEPGTTRGHPRDPPPHLGGGAPSPQRTGEQLDDYNRRIEANLRSNARVYNAMQPNAEEASDHVRFARTRGRRREGEPSEFYSRMEPPPLSTGPRPKAFRVPGEPPLGPSMGYPSTRTFSAYPPTTTAYTTNDPVVPVSLAGPHSGGIASNVMDYEGHRDVMLSQICDNIQYKVGYRLPPLPEGVKFPKIEAPGKYSGENDHDTFYIWLDGYLTWLRAYNMCGPETDRTRVFYLRQLLLGHAEEWFTQSVDNPALGYRPSFVETICAMHRRFVHSSTAAKATRDFDKCAYKASEGIDAFYADMMRFASRMVESPTDYALRLKIVDGLPQEIYRILTIDRNINPEQCTLDEIVTNVRQIEHALSRVRTREHRDSKSTPLAATVPRGRSDGANRRDTTGRAPSTGVTGDRRRDDKSDRPPSGNRFRSTDQRPPTPRPKPEGNACFGCGQVGHYANDPTCPQFGKPRPDRPPLRARFHAQRAEDAAPPSGVDGDTWGGSLYDSDEERNAPTPPSEGEESEIERAMAMRAVQSDGDDEIVLQLRAGRVEHSSTVRRKDTTPDDAQPKRDKALQASLCALVNVNGIMAYTLFDSGSTTDSVSPEFAHISGAKPVKLDEQIVLQLGCAGSRSKINYGTWVPLSYGGLEDMMYFDIVNLDRYDCVIGTPFMNKHGVKLDFNRRMIMIGDRECKAFSPAEDSDFRSRRRAAKATDSRKGTTRTR
ncbi:hypothetical protein VTO73DRAFT_7541 [Trametes versicolor]